MPAFNTGSQPWDQALGTLSGALFPDPSKRVEAYYYGSKAREAQLGSNSILDQQNNKNRLSQMVFNQDDPTATPAPAAPTFYTPDNVPGAAPIMAPPSNLPMSQAVAPGGPQGPGGGALVQPTATPGQAADQLTTTLVKNAPRLTQGTPPPMSPPSAVSPPAPTTTTTNGQSPNNDTGSGVFHPDSLNTTGGGQQYAAKAQANGSPARVPFNLGTFTATAAAAGYNAQQMDAMGAATLASLFQKGIIDENMYHQMLAGSGQATPLTTDISGRTSITTTGMNNATTLANTRLVEAGATGRADAEPIFVADDPSNPNIGHWTTKGSIKRGNVTGFNPATAPTVAGQQGAVGNYLDPKTGRVVPQTAGQAITAGMSPAPSSTDQGNAQEIAAIQAETDPVKQQALIDRFVNVRAGTSMPATPSDDEAFKNQQLQQAAVESLNPIPTGGQIRQGGTNLKPAALTAEGDSVLSHLADQYFRRNPAGGRVNAITSAYQQLVRQGYFNPNPDRSEAPLSTAAQINKLVPDPKVKGAFIAAPHFRVDLLDPKTHKPLAPGQVPTVNIDQGSLGQTVAPDASQPAPTQPAPTVPAPTVPAPTVAAPAQAAPAQAAPVPTPRVSAIFNPRATTRGQAPSTFGVPPAPEITTGRRGRPSRLGRGEAAAPPAAAPAQAPATPQAAAIGRASPGTPDGPRTMNGRPVLVQNGLIYPQ